jgi:hypothetical protein
MLQKSILKSMILLLPSTALLPLATAQKELTLAGRGTSLAALEDSRQAPLVPLFFHGVCCEFKFLVFRMFRTNVSNVSYGCCNEI